MSSRVASITQFQAGPLIMEKARMLHKVIYQDVPEDVHSKPVQAGCIGSNRGTAQGLSTEIGPYKKKVSEYIEEKQLSLHQIFNADLDFG